MQRYPPLSTGYNAVYGLEDVVLVLPHMCKNGTTANRAVTEMFLTFRDDRNVSIPTASGYWGMIGAIDSNKMDTPCRRMLRVRVTIQVPDYYHEWSWPDLCDQTSWCEFFGARRIMCYISHVVPLQNQINVRGRPGPSVRRLKVMLLHRCF